uniref:Uncharacterized protein n=1 Tax=Caenorhabditis japonica TaxID=281687 RepID=A0A8R1DH62_CAEJA
MAVYTFPVYSLVLTLISIVIEVGPTFQADDYWLPYSIFGIFMLTGGNVFYMFVAITSIGKFKSLFDSNSPVSGVGADTFFLKLGACVFAIFSIVLWSTELFLAFAASIRPLICIIRTCLYIIFHVAQLVFVSKSSRFVFHCPKVIVYFGLAHILAVNLWIWASLCIAKSGIHDDHELHHIHFGQYATQSKNVPWVLHPTLPPVIRNTTFEVRLFCGAKCGKNNY